MQRNRYFKSTTGVGGEYVIANQIDNTGTPVDGLAPTAATTSVTVAASPAVADRINFLIAGQTYTYIVKAGDTTAATLVASIVAYINATNNAAFTASVSGTTSAVFSFAAPLGTSFNGATNSVTLGAPNVSTFSAATATAWGTNGVDPVESGMQGTLDLFVANALAGSIGVYWADNKAAVLPGATGLYANRDRVFQYAFKTQDTTPNTILTSGVRAGARQYRTIAYSAGQADIYTMTFTGTYTLGQILRVRIIDTTSTQIPYPNWSYEVVSTGTIATDLTAIAALITAETQDPVATASASAGVLTITGKFNSRQIKVGFNLDTFGTSGNGAIDQSIQVTAQTQVSTSEVGTTADILEFEKYFKIQNGVMIYTPEGTLPTEFSNILSLVVTGTQYGILVVTSAKEDRHESSVMPNFNKSYVQVAIPNAAVAQLASY